MSSSVQHTLGDADFDEDYYLRHVGRPYRKDEVWLGFFTPIANHIVSEIGPRRVLDAGCGPGLLVELLRDRGIQAFGLDISSYAIARVPERVRPFCWRASVSEELREDYDLIICQEVFPHVEPADADAAIANFSRHTGDVLFSSPLSLDRSVRRHVNFSTPGHFADVFAQHGLFRDFAFDASVITPWAVRFRHTPGGAPAAIATYEDRFWDACLQRDQTAQSLTDAEQRVRNMEKSWFWRIRRPWSLITGR
jgi:2-polyprenyl-3-methyl-5-hydroxy-6-metoxy-1,4-benzoquinol methylase